jgi:hypothetical protein
MNRAAAAKLITTQIKTIMNTEDTEPEMPWETVARIAIERAVQHIEKDEAQRVIRLTGYLDEKYPDEEFSSFDALSYRLEEIGAAAWNDNVPCDGGPVFEADVDVWVDMALEDIGAEEFFEKNK